MPSAKLEGGGSTADTMRFLVERGVPVRAHLGQTPQSAHALGGCRVQGRDEPAAQALHRQARELADAGASMLVVELMPSALVRELTAPLPIPAIGIGAGAGCGGQVLVLHDMLGLTRGKLPRFVRDFMADGGAAGGQAGNAGGAGGAGNGIEAALRRYVAAVKDGSFPDESIHGY